MTAVMLRPSPATAAASPTIDPVVAASPRPRWPWWTALAAFAQYGMLRHISRSELRPGDLLFYFGGSAHHVAMYIGGGMMVSASNPRDGVEVIAAWGPWYGSRYSGAARVV